MTVDRNKMHDSDALNDACVDEAMANMTRGDVPRPMRWTDGTADVRGENATTLQMSVERWAADAHQAADELRAEAALRILQCWETDATVLDLRDLRLSTLPPGLWMLSQRYPRRTPGMQGMPMCERSPADDRHTEPSQPSQPAARLRQLLLDGNCLRVLPERIACLSSLRHLSVAHNRLTSLPDALKRLPALSYLNVAANDLEGLPDALGEAVALEFLRADGCLLRWIPPSLGSLPLLRELDVSDNALTSLPDAIRWLPAACVVRLHDNPLPDRVRRALRDGPAAPVWMFDHRGAQPFSRTLDEAAFAWLIAGADRCRASLDVWQGIAARHPDVACALTRLLDDLGSLPEATNGDTRKAFRAAVRDVLKDIEAAPAGVIRFLAQAETAMPRRREAEHGDLPVADDLPGEVARRRAAWTRTHWAGVCAAVPPKRQADKTDIVWAPRKPLSDGDLTLGPACEERLRTWIDNYVVAHPLLDCADVLHACRIVVGHFDRHAAVQSFPRPVLPALRSSAPAFLPLAPALHVMSEDDIVDCLRTVRTEGEDGHSLAGDCAERGNCIG
ncbi:leucine-rich repeat domain-containing protein [Robbsia sp. KACC 23696]|uniref:leucine-rich repeat domain-containing protein n=1 Tax=Robbsia sp. KACC 23696 TaxID=3149231 RepID=UPI00325A599C